MPPLRVLLGGYPERLYRAPGRGRALCLPELLYGPVRVRLPAGAVLRAGAGAATPPACLPRPRQVEPRPRPETGGSRALEALAALVNQGVQVLRAGLIAIGLLLIVLYGAKQRPAIRPYEPNFAMVQYQMNKVERQTVRLRGRVMKVFTIKERSTS